MSWRNGVDYLGADPEATADCLEALVDDMRRLAAGWAPSSADLLLAPALSNWAFAKRPGIGLVGHSLGHPVILDGRRAMTSELYAIDTDRRWARTMSRFYILDGQEKLDG